MKILVTGAAGFIGMHVATRLRRFVEWYLPYRAAGGTA
jgi:nucleoside-diphosphate-sugar epimerase